MLQLNLPAYDHKLKSVQGKLQIYDPIRKKYVHLTPEEWVRQHMLNLLNKELNYPASRTSVEGGLKYNQRAKRTDIIVYNDEMKPQLLVECKAPHISLNQKTIDQLATYNKLCRAALLVTTNGIQTYAMFCEENEQVKMLNEIPDHKKLIEMI